MDTIDEACQRTVEALEKQERPTAFFARIDMMTIGIYSGINQCGMQIPQDISVVGFDDIFVTKHMIPPLVSRPNGGNCENAVKMLSELI